MLVRIEIPDRLEQDDTLRRRLQALRRSNGHRGRQLIGVLNLLSTSDDTMRIDVEPRDK